MKQKILFHGIEFSFKRTRQVGTDDLRGGYQIHPSDFSRELAEILFEADREGKPIKIIGYVEVEDDFLPPIERNDDIARDEIENHD